MILMITTIILYCREHGIYLSGIYIYPSLSLWCRFVTPPPCELHAPPTAPRCSSHKSQDDRVLLLVRHRLTVSVCISCSCGFSVCGLFWRLSLAISAVNHAPLWLCGDWGLPRRVSFTYHLPGEVKVQKGTVSIYLCGFSPEDYIQQVCLFTITSLHSRPPPQNDNSEVGFRNQKTLQVYN